jgi:DNA polymerase (family 10)
MIDDERDDGYHPTFDDEQYIDEVGRPRWRRNAELAAHLRRLQDFLVIGGYPESHALRYGRLALDIDQLGESIALVEKEDRLKRIRGVGPDIANMIAEFLRKGTTSKYEWWKRETPESVLDLLDIPGFGVKTVRTLYMVYAIKNISDLRRAVGNGTLDGVRGIGPKTLTNVRKFLDERTV